MKILPSSGRSNPVGTTNQNEAKRLARNSCVPSSQPFDAIEDSSPHSNAMRSQTASARLSSQLTEFVNKHERATAAAIIGAGAAPLLVGLPVPSIAEAISFKPDTNNPEQVAKQISRADQPSIEFNMDEHREVLEKFFKAIEAFIQNLLSQWQPDFSSNESGRQTTPYAIPKELPNQLESWAQGTEGNCASVAVIKAAIDQFGSNIFRSVNSLRDGSGFEITMRDGEVILLTHEELELVKSESNFKHGFASLRGRAEAEIIELNEIALDFANFAYAAMVKRKAKIQGLTLPDALSDLNDGVRHPRMPAIWIGLSHKVESVNKSHFNGRDSIVAWGQDHAVFIARTDPGRYQEDNWGRAEPYDGIIADYYTVGAFAFNKDKKPPLLRFKF